MTYHLARDGTQLGTYEDSDIPAALASGKIRMTDLAWCEGMGDWQPLSSIVEVVQEETTQPVGAPAPPPMPVQQPIPMSIPMPTTATSGKAITSLVLGLVSVVCGCFTGLPALLFGILAINQIGKSGGTLGGKGIAIAGMVLGAVMMIFGTAVLAGLAVPAFNGVQEKARQLQASNNARSIIITMKAYAGDHDGKYPDADASNPRTANEAFRALVKAGLLDDERVFGAPNSSVNPDNNIGEAPDYADAVMAGENCWALTKGLSDSDKGSLPLIFQAPNSAAWPLTWDADNASKTLGGKVWRGGKVIIGRNDGSVNAEDLESAHGTKVGLRDPLFDPAHPREILMPEP